MPTTVDKIRRALEKRDGIAEDEMRPLAEAYRTQVDEVNRRLDDAVMLLRKGLRSEAIQRVEMTPNALDAAAELEFPEWDEWNEILQFMGIPLPPKLNQDYVAQINEAIIESLPLDALLRRHRRLAIAKASLAVRLRTLRQIARVDSTNSVWQDDVESWEKVRLGQIDSELKQAVESEDSRYLYQLHKELTGSPWRVAPSSRLIEQTTFAAEAHVRQTMETELGKLAPQLNKAFENRDETTARAIRTQWQNVRARHNVAVPDHLEISVGPAMQWLEDLDRQAVMESERQMAMTNLQSTLESNSSIEDVQNAYDQASRFGAPIPEELKQQVETLSSQPAKEAKRKLILIAAAAAVIVIAALVGAGMYMSSSSAANTRAQTIGEMERLVSSEDYEGALSYFSSLLTTQPQIAQEPRMVALKAQAQKAVDQVTARQERFDKLLAQADNEDASLIDATLLPQLDELATTPGERARVDQLRQRRADYDKAESLRQSDELIGKVAELQSQFNALRSRGSSETNRQAIQDLLISIARLPNQYPESSSDARARQETLRSMVSSELTRMKDEGRMSSQRRDAINDLLGSRSLEVYSDRLRRYSTQSVARTGLIDFDIVIDEEDHWMDVDRTNEWLKNLADKLKDGITSTEASGLLESAESLQNATDHNPVFTSMRRFNDSMKEIVGRRVLLDGTFSRLAKHPLAKIVSLPIEEGGNPIHYLVYKSFVEQNRRLMDRSGNIGIPIIADSLGGIRQRSFPGPLPQTINEPMNSVESILNAKSKLAIDFDREWERTFMVQISSVMDRQDLDGVIKEWLIHELLSTAIAGSSRFKEMTILSMRVLQRRTDVRRAWHEPRPFDASLNPEVRQAVRNELQTAYARFKNPFAEFQEVAEKRLQWVGFISKSKSGSIEHHLRPNITTEDGTLYVAAAPREGSADTDMLQVGKLINGHVQLNANPVNQVPGRPLFLFPN